MRAPQGAPTYYLLSCHKFPDYTCCFARYSYACFVGTDATARHSSYLCAPEMGLWIIDVVVSSLIVLFCHFFDLVPLHLVFLVGGEIILLEWVMCLHRVRSTDL